MRPKRIPHPIPYQGSKRNLAPEILRYFPKDIDTLYEPFAGSAAISIAAAATGLCRRFVINDLNKPLADLLDQIINDPEKLADEYQNLWFEQLDDPRAFYNKIRDEFNQTGEPALFLYLLARCVKASVRYNAHGEFNQSADHRRKGMKPETMRMQVLGVSYFLKGKTVTRSKNYRDILALAGPKDMIYMDPPYQGVCGNRDTRYLQRVQFGEFVEEIKKLNDKKVRFIISYDGRTGRKSHGKPLPAELNLSLIELDAGRSSQATLLGRDFVTIESLYLSPALAAQLSNAPTPHRYAPGEQSALLESRV